MCRLNEIMFVEACSWAVILWNGVVGRRRVAVGVANLSVMSNKGINVAEKQERSHS